MERSRRSPFCHRGASRDGARQGHLRQHGAVRQQPGGRLDANQQHRHHRNGATQEAPRRSRAARREVRAQHVRRFDSTGAYRTGGSHGQDLHAIKDGSSPPRKY
ncbi:MAG: hypothetical protein JF601_00550 [Acidobacteria bacterium]|nr:hypothetical protein [Acidobacteriota bacterium]